MNNDRSEVKKQTTRRIVGKLVIILIAVGAYFGLYGLENLKNNYDKEQAAPLVLVYEPNPQERKEIAIPVTEVKKMISFTKVADLETRKKYEEEMGRYLETGMMYQPFRNEAALIDDLNGRILAKKLEDEKAQLAATANNIKSIEALRTDLSDISRDPNDVLIKRGINTDGLTTIIPLNQEEGSAVAVSSSSEAKKYARSQLVEKIMQQLKQKETTAYQNQIAVLDKVAIEKIEGIYSSLKPSLPRYVGEARETIQERNSFFRNVLDTNSGSHVIYQVVRLSFLAALAFTVLFVILMLLRPWPPFSNNTETLIDQAKSFLSRRGGEGGALPEMAKSLAVTAAAFGIGTAVVVAGGVGNGPSTKVAGEHTYVAEGDSSTEQPWRKPTPPRYPPPGPEVSPSRGPDDGTGGGTSDPQPPVIYRPEFHVPRVDEGKIANLETRIDGLTTQVNQTVVPRVNELDQANGTFRNQLGDVNVPLLNQTVKANYDELKGATGGLRNDLSQLGAKLDTSFSEKLKETQNLVEGIRSDNLERLLRNEGRSIGTRTRQFLFTTEQYIVSEPSYRALVSIMCTAPCGEPGNCPIVCPGSLGVNDLLLKLREMRGEPPKEEKRFVASLKSDPNFKSWKTVILRYTRTTY